MPRLFGIKNAGGVLLVLWRERVLTWRLNITLVCTLSLVTDASKLDNIAYKGGRMRLEQSLLAESWNLIYIGAWFRSR